MKPSSYKHLLLAGEQSSLLLEKRFEMVGAFGGGGGLCTQLLHHLLLPSDRRTHALLHLLQCALLSTSTHKNMNHINKTSTELIR